MLMYGWQIYLRFAQTQRNTVIRAHSYHNTKPQTGHRYQKKNTKISEAKIMLPNKEKKLIVILPVNPSQYYDLG